jgi:hypothetical protein
MRRARIREKLHTFLRRFHSKEFSESDWNAAVEDSSNYGEIMEQLFAACESSLKKLHDRGISLAPSWRQRFSTSQ